MTKSNNLPIGFFDSGVGGISVLRETVRLLPNENYIYLGDNKNVPYGIKTENEIKEISLNCARLLFDIGVKCIVVACNTATSVSINEIRRLYSIPIISIEPAIKPAVEQISKGNILVMATPATLNQERYHTLINRLSCRSRVIDLPCPELAELVEKYIDDDFSLMEYLSLILKKYYETDIRGIVLGCTHYSFIQKEIRDIAIHLFNRDIQMFDGKFGVARHVRDVLKKNNMFSNIGTGSIRFIATGEQSELKKFYTFYNYKSEL